MEKVLIVHTKYQQIGGEDIAVLNEYNFLKNKFIVEIIYFDNSKFNIFTLLKIFLFNVNQRSLNELKLKIKEFDPDFIYIHNLWFNGSVGLLKYLVKSDINFALKLHNFRNTCTKNILTKNHIGFNTFCMGCGNEYKKSTILNKYFKDSWFKSILVMRYGKSFFKILKSHSFPIFVLTDFYKSYLMSLGFNENRITVLRNYIKPQNFKANTSPKTEKYIVYAGLISKEKGIEELIAAFKKSKLISEGYKLKIIGNGPIFKNVKQQYQSSEVEFLGQLSNEITLDIISKSKAVVTATKLYEGQPTLLCEATNLKVLSIFPNNGGIAEFFPPQTKFKFTSNDYEALKNKFDLLLDDQVVKEEIMNNYEFLEKLIDENYIFNQFSKVINKEISDA